MVTHRSLYRYVYVRTQVSIHTYIPLLCQLRGPRRNETPVAMGKRGAQILVSPRKGNRASWRMAGSRTGTGNIQDESGVYCSNRN